MTGRFVLKIGDHLENAETKKYYTEKNFSEVAPRYDFITRVLSFGRDAAWKRTLISLLPSHESPVCVDLACGTGDIAFLLAGKYARGRIAGLDITELMLHALDQTGDRSAALASFARRVSDSEAEVLRRALESIGELPRD